MEKNRLKISGTKNCWSFRGNSFSSRALLEELRLEQEGKREEKQKPQDKFQGQGQVCIRVNIRVQFQGQGQHQGKFGVIVCFRCSLEPVTYPSSLGSTCWFHSRAPQGYGVSKSRMILASPPAGKRQLCLLLLPSPNRQTCGLRVTCHLLLSSQDSFSQNSKISLSEQNKGEIKGELAPYDYTSLLMC